MESLVKIKHLRMVPSVQDESVYAVVLIRQDGESEVYAQEPDISSQELSQVFWLISEELK